MQTTEQLLHAGDTLLESLKSEIDDVRQIVASIPWSEEFTHETNGALRKHQAAYNAVLAESFATRGWTVQPELCADPQLIGDFRKGLVFGEIQFGNSATLYRDFYKFQYGLQHGLLSLAVLIVPENENDFFPTRARSVHNMANFSRALQYFTVLPIAVPTWLIGLRASNRSPS